MNWLQITSGRGPVESQRFVAFLADEVSADAKTRGLDCRLIDGTPGEVMVRQRTADRHHAELWTRWPACQQDELRRSSHPSTEWLVRRGTARTLATPEPCTCAGAAGADIRAIGAECHRRETTETWSASRISCSCWRRGANPQPTLTATARPASTTSCCCWPAGLREPRR